LGAETLYNGITTPDGFPPVLDQPWSTNELPYYILQPPEVIRIDVGRQLFVDDFLIETTRRLIRRSHQPTPYSNNPIIWPTDEDVHVRQDTDGYFVRTHEACPFSDGVWWDAAARSFRAWHMGGPNSLRLSESVDGFVWNRWGEDGRVMTIPPERNSGTVWIDPIDPDPARRYKMAYFAYADLKNWLYTSADGVNWPSYKEPVAKTAYYSSNPEAPTGDRTTFFYNPFRKKWVWSLRDIRDRRDFGGIQYHRMRRYWEGDDLFESCEGVGQSGFWLEADDRDLEEAGEPGRPQLTVPQFYNIDAFPYESIMVFGLTMLSSNAWLDRAAGQAFPKRNQVYVGFSRDGFYMTRPPGSTREPFVEIGEAGAWNEGNVQTVGSGCVIVGQPEQERLLFYYSGRRNDLAPDGTLNRYSHLGCAQMRRDGFVSIDAIVGEGVLTTRRLQFESPNGYLFVNAKVDTGRLEVEMLEEDGTIALGLSRDDSTPMAADSTRFPMRWGDRISLSAFSGRPFKLRFYLNHGQLYSFWISPTPAGASEGYLAGGGPGYEGYVDASPPDTSGTGNESPDLLHPIEVMPNPIETSATIQFKTTVPEHVSVSVYDVAGRFIGLLSSGFLSAGTHRVRFDRGHLAPGHYFVRVESRSTRASATVVLGAGL